MSRHRSRLPDKDESEETKAKNMTYYNVLGVSEDAGLSEIKKQFRKLAVKYHPDHRETGDAGIFALVARAYECLSNDHKREEYDRMLSIERKARKSDYTSQKKAFEEFIKAQETDVSAKGIEHVKSKFRLDWDDMDRKRGVRTTGKLEDKKLGQLDEEPLSSIDAVKRLKDIKLEREQDEIEFTQPEIFTADNFDRERFNALFEFKYKQSKDDQLVKHTGMPSAFNDVQGSSFISCEGHYDDMFDEGNEVSGTDMYGSISDTGKKVKVSKDDLDKVRGSKTEFSSHNVISKDYKSDIEKRLKEREFEDKLYESRKIQDYDTDKTMGGYGFLHHVGLTGRDMEWDREEIDESTIQKLIAYRESEDKNIRGKMKKY
jgi:curved DNA-binding protein CbpA